MHNILERTLDELVLSPRPQPATGFERVSFMETKKIFLLRFYFDTEDRTSKWLWNQISHCSYSKYPKQTLLDEIRIWSSSTSELYYLYASNVRPFKICCRSDEFPTRLILDQFPLSFVEHNKSSSFPARRFTELQKWVLIFPERTVLLASMLYTSTLNED